MDDSMSELAPLHHQLRLMVRRWLPIALSRAGAEKREVERLRGEHTQIVSLAEQIEFARELAQANHAKTCETRNRELDSSADLVVLTDRLAATLALGPVDLEAATASASTLQRDLIGFVMGVQIHEPRPRAVTPSWARVPLPMPVLRI